MAEIAQSDSSFRDQLYNVDSGGRRVGFFPKKPKGKFYNYRSVVSYILLAIMFVTPWIKIHGEPFMLFNILERKFILFGVTFWPQDFHLFLVAALIMVVSIVLFTVAFGRIWCGWACPQTIFLEMVYRKIEYWIEGDSIAQRKLDKAPWDTKKTFKRTLKHSIFLGIAFLVSNTVLAYVIGMDNVLQYVSESPMAHPWIFGAVVANTALFYFVFAKFRELACIMACPYGRLQGVLLDNNSVVVHYDFKRGEPRAKIKRKAEETADKGDCIDCKQCVAVCPTGIDIRNGTQLECVNCTACIDVCDEIMTKVKRPTGLTRFASYNMVEKGEQFRFTTRSIAYSSVLVLLGGLFMGLLLTRGDLESTILRVPGKTYTMTDDGYYSNFYTFNIVNKSPRDRQLVIKLTEENDGRLKMVGEEIIHLDSSNVLDGAFFIELPPAEVQEYAQKLRLDIYEGDRKVESVKTSFIGPMK